MDIVFQTEVDPGNGPAKARTPIKAPTPNPLKVMSQTSTALALIRQNTMKSKLRSGERFHLCKLTFGVSPDEGRIVHMEKIRV